MKARRIAMLARKARQIIAAKSRRWRGIDYRSATLQPSGPSRGRVLLSYIIDPFLLAPDAEPPHGHTHYWESREIGRAWVDEGFTVDVIHWLNDRFVPQKNYDVFIDVRYNLERLAPLVGPGCLKLMHMETAESGFHNAAEARRLDDLERRRGIRLKPRRWMKPSRAIEFADAATVLGNNFTMSTFATAGKPMFRVPISTPRTWPYDAGRDFAAARNRFLWFGPSGLVHKGLDLVLEAFAGMPELELAVFGPIENERDFVDAYEKELYGTPNIHLEGWVDIDSPRWARATRNSIAVVYPSCSESGGGSVITCMHAGLIPMATPETSVDLAADYGVVLDDVSIAGIRRSVRALAARAPAELTAMSRASWEYARAHHTRESFALGYRDAIRRILNPRP